jgi:cyclopropane fatty-acyl-phospholipid synthase-like methyltransferase
MKDESATTLHPRDITAVDLEAASAISDRPELLRELVATSRQTFGFYTSHYPHTINYPWVIERLERLPQGSRVLDIGAGLSPVPIVLVERGMFVDTVDKHPTIRTLACPQDWNEWGFFDYSRLYQNLASHHCDVAEFTPPAPFDAIYSISVLAHMTRVVREDTLRRCRDWLRPGGCLLFAIDVIPSSDFLWNRSEGLEVEPPIQHGAVADVVEQLAELGFEINESKVVRGVYKSRTDLLFIHCTRSC